MADREQDPSEGAPEETFRWPSSAPRRPPEPGADPQDERLAPPAPAWAPAFGAGSRLAGGLPRGADFAQAGYGAAEHCLEDYDAAEFDEPCPGPPDRQPDPGLSRSCAGPAPAGPAFAGRASAGPGGDQFGRAHPFGAVDRPGVRAGQPASLLAGDLLRPARFRPVEGGWRRVVQQASGGLVRPPESPARRRERELTERACAPVTGGHHRVAVLSLKGGVGKTTTVMGLGLTLAALRGDRVIAVDANPDRGTLCDKLRLETSATVRDLVSERGQIRRYADVRAYTTQTSGRLEVLASDRDPTISVAFSDEDYRAVADVLERHYSICLTDCGTGLLHSAMSGVLALADQIVLVSTPSVDGARSASATLDWLVAHGHGALARDAVVVLSMIRRRGRTAVDLGRLEEHFATRCRAVVKIPHDAHLEEGAEVDLAQLDTATAAAFLSLAAEVADGFTRPPRAGRQHGTGGPG